MLQGVACMSICPALVGLTWHDACIIMPPVVMIMQMCDYLVLPPTNGTAWYCPCCQPAVVRTAGEFRTDKALHTCMGPPPPRSNVRRASAVLQAGTDGRPTLRVATGNLQLRNATARGLVNAAQRTLSRQSAGQQASIFNPLRTHARISSDGPAAQPVILTARRMAATPPPPPRATCKRPSMLLLLLLLCGLAAGGRPVATRSHKGSKLTAARLPVANSTSSSSSSVLHPASALPTGVLGVDDYWNRLVGAPSRLGGRTTKEGVLPTER